MVKREARPVLSCIGEQMLTQYEQHLRVEEDLTATTIRNYLSDLRHFAVWCEATWKQGYEEEPSFRPEVVATPTITDYRTYLQHILHLKPTSVNRTLVSLKRYFGWVLSTGHLKYDPAKVVKLVAEEAPPLRHLNDQEEQALIAAVTQTGSVRDRAIITLLLHTGLRARELCTLTRTQVSLGERSGAISALGKRNKYREIPLNATARAALLAYDSSLQTSPQDATPLFLSEKRLTRLTERGLGYLIKKYAMRAKLQNVSPHDLRHRFGYRMATSFPLHWLAQLMGHASLDTTMVYMQRTRSNFQSAVKMIAWTEKEWNCRGGVSHSNVKVRNSGNYRQNM